jgi:hypothetical protein
MLIGLMELTKGIHAVSVKDQIDGVITFAQFSEIQSVRREVDTAFFDAIYNHLDNGATIFGNLDGLFAAAVYFEGIF